MTRRGLGIWLALILIYIICLILLGLKLSNWGKTADLSQYRVFKDLVPLLLAVPAAWLGALFQKRTSFLTGARTLYESAIKTIHEVIEYTYLNPPQLSDYVAITKKIDITMDLLRGTFKDVHEGTRYYYPFDTLGEIRHSLGELGYGAKFEGEESAATARTWYREQWTNKLRPVILNELDIHLPSLQDSSLLEGRRQTVIVAARSIKSFERHRFFSPEVERIIEENSNLLSKQRALLYLRRLRRKIGRNRWQELPPPDRSGPERPIS